MALGAEGTRTNSNCALSCSPWTAIAKTVNTCKQAWAGVRISAGRHVWTNNFVENGFCFDEDPQICYPDVPPKIRRARTNHEQLPPDSYCRLVHTETCSPVMFQGSAGQGIGAIIRPPEKICEYVAFGTTQTTQVRATHGTTLISWGYMRIRAVTYVTPINSAKRSRSANL